MKALWTALAALTIATPCSAAAVLDQSFLIANPTDYETFSSDSQPGAQTVQTFTAGRSGRLTQVDIQTPAFTAPFVELAIYAVENGMPIYEQVLGRGRFVALNGTLSTFSTEVDLVAGRQYGLDPITTEPIFYIWWARSRGGGYDGGQSFFIYPGGGEATGNDLGFQTYVDSALPEPGTWLTFNAGFGLTGAALRRRREARLGDPTLAFVPG